MSSLWLPVFTVFVIRGQALSSVSFPCHRCLSYGVLHLSNWSFSPNGPCVSLFLPPRSSAVCRATWQGPCLLPIRKWFRKHFVPWEPSPHLPDESWELSGGAWGSTRSENFLYTNPRLVNEELSSEHCVQICRHLKIAVGIEIGERHSETVTH